jgi:RHS repeat-associated protein
MLNSNGSVADRFVYDPFGKGTMYDANWNLQGALSSTWKYYFQGGRFDGSTGLYNYRYRDLSPTLGRWMQQDPVRDKTAIQSRPSRGLRRPGEVYAVGEASSVRRLPVITPKISGKGFSRNTETATFVAFLVPTFRIGRILRSKCLGILRQPGKGKAPEGLAVSTSLPNIPLGSPAR